MGVGGKPSEAYKFPRRACIAEAFEASTGALRNRSLRLLAAALAARLQVQVLSEPQVGLYPWSEQKLGPPGLMHGRERPPASAYAKPSSVRQKYPKLQPVPVSQQSSVSSLHVQPLASA